MRVRNSTARKMLSAWVPTRKRSATFVLDNRPWIKSARQKGRTRLATRQEPRSTTHTESTSCRLGKQPGDSEGFPRNYRHAQWSWKNHRQSGPSAYAPRMGSEVTRNLG